MGQKDLTQKNLEDYPDVFADIINALLYGGQPMVRPEDLRPAPTETLYAVREGLWNQFHDVSKYEMECGRVRLQYTLENQTGCDHRLLLRKAGYEGAVYREQYDKKREETYPVIGVVLHWGGKSWRGPKSIHSFFKDRRLPGAVLRYINNVKFPAFDMRFLSPKERRGFRSDMRIVVDYLAEGKAYVPTGQKLKHPEALLWMLKQLSGDERYLSLLDAWQEDGKEGEVTMCELLDKYWNEGVATGVQTGLQEGMRVLVETCQDFGLTQGETTARLIQKFSLSQEEGRECIQKYWNA